MKWGSSDTVRGTGTGRRETGAQFVGRDNKRVRGRARLPAAEIAESWGGRGRGLVLFRVGHQCQSAGHNTNAAFLTTTSAADKPIPLATYEYMFRQRDAFFFLWGSEGEGKGSKGKMAGDEVEVAAPGPFGMDDMTLFLDFLSIELLSILNRRRLLASSCSVVLPS